jgi:hypothetical protein
MRNGGRLSTAITTLLRPLQTVDRRPAASSASAAGWASGVAFVALVAAVTFATRAHELPITPFVASAAKVAAGKLWVLPASALVVDRPVLIGLAAFAALAVATLRFCGTRTFWLAAVVGHICSALAVDAIIGVVRLSDPQAFAPALVSPDFGVSAMQGAWVGALALTAWSWARGDRRRRALVVAGVCAITVVAWWLHPSPSILTTEHGFAFLIGCCVVAWPQRASRGAAAARRA